jgi:acetyl-CoA carboxylase carboxyltransferase component
VETEISFGMAILDTALDPRAPSFLDNRSTALAALAALESAHTLATDGGGEKEVTRHHARGKLLPRERIELLVDRDSALLELAATAGRQYGEPPGAGLVTALGVIEGTECVLVASDPTVRQSTVSVAGQRKFTRAVEIAARHQLPLVLLLEGGSDSGIGTVTGTAIAAQPLGGLGQAGVPVVCVVLGPLDPAFAMLPGLADHAIAVRGHANGHADLIAEDERDALRVLRQSVRRLRPLRPALTAALPAVAPPRFDGDELLAVASADPRRATDPREVLARVLDGSELDEFRPQRGAGILAGFGTVHAHRVAVLANTAPTLDAESAQKGAELVTLAAALQATVLVLANPVQASEPDGAALLRAMARADARQITVILGADPAEWALAGRGFRFTWPVGLLTADPYDGVIDPRDTRTTVGICLSVGEVRQP